MNEGTVTPETLEIARILRRDIERVLVAHTHSARGDADVARRFDRTTPYAIHPIWCAMTLLQEATLPRKVRLQGARVLLYHDFLEDTTAQLPGNLSSFEIQLIEGMTFENLDQEMEEIWRREKFIWLLKLYDKVSNMADGTWMTKKRRVKMVAYVQRLADEVEKEWGDLNIVRFARASC